MSKEKLYIAKKEDLSSHISDTNAHVSEIEKNAWNSATKVEASTTNGNIKINNSEVNVYTHPSGTNPHGTTKSDIGLDNVENKSSETIRSEITSSNVTTALGYTPLKTEEDPTVPSYVKEISESDISGWNEGAKVWVGTKAEYEIEKSNIPNGSRIYFTDDSIEEIDMGNYYTKSEIDNLISIVPKFKVDIANSLDEVTEPDPYTIYLVPGESGSDIIFREYIYINNVWKLLGVQGNVIAYVDDTSGVLHIG